jgi:hypothetical protein
LKVPDFGDGLPIICRLKKKWTWAFTILLCLITLCCGSVQGVAVAAARQTVELELEAAGSITREGHRETAVSSDDSSNSENEDTHLLLEAHMTRTSRHTRGNRRRRWRPHLNRDPYGDNNG